MSSKVDFFLSKTLGEDFIESLNKVELWKPGTRTTIDHEEIKTALQIVPRTILAFLIKELTPMEIGETKEVSLPLNREEENVLRVTKHERDVYSGDIITKDKMVSIGKVVTDFKYRSIPGVGLVVMSSFELYDVEKLEEEPKISDDLSDRVQKLVDERLALHDLIEKVVDKKIEQREAINRLILDRLSQTLRQHISIPVAPVKEVKALEVPQIPIEQIEDIAEDPKKKKNKFKDFFEKKKKHKEFSIEMVKGEKIVCPDCGNILISDSVFTGCVCFGDSSKVYIKKSENGIKVRFGHGWEQENISMLLSMLRGKNE